MKIAAWNINSIRARLQRLVSWLGTFQPDVLCLQELKCTDDDFPALELKAAGYHSACFGQKTYNGVAIVSKQPLSEVVRGIPDGVEDAHSRFIAATVGTGSHAVRCISVYAPNGQAVDSPAYVYKLRWYERLTRYLEDNQVKSGNWVIGGDYNIAPEPIDLHDPAAWEGQTLFTLPERTAFRQLTEAGLVDTFRALHPDEAGKYSWWDYRMLGFPKNRGLRIDFILASPSMSARCTVAGIDREARKGKLPSDHAPVWAEFS